MVNIHRLEMDQAKLKSETKCATRSSPARLICSGKESTKGFSFEDRKLRMCALHLIC